MVYSKIYLSLHSQKCPDGGIGRRAGLKHQWIHFHAGSIPALGTVKMPDGEICQAFILS